MLMFSNGLLATFIPEILMVIGYIVCLLTPGFHSNSSPVSQTVIIDQISIVESDQVSAYSLSFSDFQSAGEIGIHNQPPLVCENKKCDNTFTGLLFTLSDCVSYVQFSRPPPALLY